MRKKPLIDRIKKVACDRIVNQQELCTFHSDIQFDWIKMEMYNRLIEELRKNHFIEETIEDTPDYKRISMRLLVVEPEEFTDEE